MAPMFYRNSNAAILVYDITNYTSFEGMQRWVAELKRHVDEPMVLMLVGNKVDLEGGREVMVDEAIGYAKKIGAHHYETSAKEDMVSASLKAEDFGEIVAITCRNDSFSSCYESIITCRLRSRLGSLMGMDRDINKYLLLEKRLPHSLKNTCAKNDNVNVYTSYLENVYNPNEEYAIALCLQGIEQVFQNTAVQLVRLAGKEHIDSLKVYEVDDDGNILNRSGVDDSRIVLGKVEDVNQSINSIAIGSKVKPRCFCM